MYFLGVDLGTSSIKASIVDAQTTKVVASAQYPEIEADIISLASGWAEQSPELWWQNTQIAIKKAIEKLPGSAHDIAAIGISYQMHGLVLVDSNQNVLRNSIIWCDSRAVPYGDAAFQKIGPEKALKHLLNSPGNFTAAKLAWVKANEPNIYAKIDQLMLPGDFLAMKLTGAVTCSNSGLSEGIFWDFINNEVSKDLINAFDFSPSFVPKIKPVFSEHGQLLAPIAAELGLKAGIPVSYKAGDQPNNALSLGVLNPGEVAATAGTSGVVYAVTDQVAYDPQSRVNTFAHVNHQMNANQNRLGVLLCINGTGILNRWVKDQVANEKDYIKMNQQAQQISVGSEGLTILPFGNGAERVLGNRNIGASIHGLDFNHHTQAHMIRAAQEGIAFSLHYGMQIMAETGNKPAIIKAGRANMFLSPIFSQSLVNIANIPVEMYETDGAKGAALGAGIGIGHFATAEQAFEKLEHLGTIEPNKTDSDITQEAYNQWLTVLDSKLN